MESFFFVIDWRFQIFYGLVSLLRYYHILPLAANSLQTKNRPSFHISSQRYFTLRTSDWDGRFSVSLFPYKPLAPWTWYVSDVLGRRCMSSKSVRERTSPTNVGDFIVLSCFGKAYSRQLP